MVLDTYNTYGTLNWALEVCDVNVLCGHVWPWTLLSRSDVVSHYFQCIVPPFLFGPRDTMIYQVSKLINRDN